MCDAEFCFQRARELAFKISRTVKSSAADDVNSDDVKMRYVLHMFFFVLISSLLYFSSPCETTTSQSAFIAAYETVMKSVQAAKEVAQLEASYAAALAELVASKNAALTNLHKR